MINLFKSKKFCRIIIAIILIYTITVVINQQSKLNEYDTQKKYYSSQITTLKEE